MKFTFVKRRDDWYQVNWHARQLGLVKKFTDIGWMISYPRMTAAQAARGYLTRRGATEALFNARFLTGPRN